MIGAIPLAAWALGGGAAAYKVAEVQASAGVGTEVVEIHTEVLYHRDADGFASAFAAWCALGEAGVRYRSVQYDEPLPELAPRARVFVVDFSYPRAVLLEWIRVGHEVVVLDHHKTAEEELRGLACAHFDMSKAGCELAWDYFSREENISDQAPAAELLAMGLPWVLRAVADRDLWVFAHADTRAICARLDLVPWKFAEWWAIVDTAGSSEAKALFIAEGEVLLKHQEQIAQRQAKKHSWLRLRDTPGPVPSCNAAVLPSETAHALLARFPACPVVAVYAWEEDGVRVSLRGTGSVDVSALAARYGGGGHRNAAGFFVRREMTVDPVNYDVHVPGQWVCPKCQFTTVKSIIAPAGVFVDEREHNEACPNDGTPMERLTWKAHAEGLEKAMSSWAERADRAEQALKATSGPESGTALIRLERARQMAVEGWTVAHDDRHTGGELAWAAGAYINHSAGLPALSWPWPEKFKAETTPLRALVKAGALIAAEIDRLLRAQKEGTAKGTKNAKAIATRMLELLDADNLGAAQGRHTNDTWVHDDYRDRLASMVEPLLVNGWDASEEALERIVFGERSEADESMARFGVAWACLSETLNAIFNEDARPPSGKGEAQG